MGCKEFKQTLKMNKSPEDAVKDVRSSPGCEQTYFYIIDKDGFTGCCTDPNFTPD